MNKKELILDLIGEYASYYADEQTVTFNLLEFEGVNPPQDLLQAKDYYTDKCEKCLSQINTLLEPKTFSISKQIIIYTTLFQFVILVIEAIKTHSMLITGLAGLYPCLIYLVVNYPKSRISDTVKL